MYKSRELKINVNLFFSIIVFLYYFLIFFDYLYDVKVLQYINFGLSLTVVYFFCLRLNKNTYNILVIVLLVMLMLASNFYNGNKNLLGLLFSTSYFLVGIIIINTKLNHKIFTFSFFIHTAILLFFILTGKDANEIFKNISRNYISVIMLMQYSLLYLSFYMNNKKMTIIPSFLVVIVSIFSMGRSGIISGLILFVGNYIFSIKNFRINKLVTSKKKSLLILVLVLIAFFIFFSDGINFLDNVKVATNRFNNINISENPRSEIIREYFISASSLGNFLWGVNISKIPLFQYWNLNLHNSFLHLHAEFGILGVAFIVFGLIKKMVQFIKKREGFFLVLLISIIVRSLTDKVAFSGIYDSLFITFILLRVRVYRPKLEFINQTYKKKKLLQNKYIQTDQNF
jgi:hypothetical protein